MDLQLYGNNSGSLLWPWRPKTTTEAMGWLGGMFDFSTELMDIESKILMLMCTSARYPQASQMGYA